MSKDSGVSVVIAFVTILTIVAIAVGMWALIGIPGQIREANEAHVITVTDSMTDYKVMLDNLHKDEFKNLNVSTLLPVGSLYSGQIRLDSETVGTLSVVKNGYEHLWSQDVNRFMLSVGSGSVIGYEGGGVFRSDNGNTVWSVYPKFNLLNVSDDLKIEIGDISNITGDFSLGTSGEIAVNTQFINSNSDIDNTGITGYKDTDGIAPDESFNQNYTITYTADISNGVEAAKKDANLWYSLFYESYSVYQNSGAVIDDDNLSVTEPSISGVDGNVVTMIIKSHCAENSAFASMSGYTYKAELVPEYIVKEAVVDSGWVKFTEEYNLEIETISWDDLLKLNPIQTVNGGVYYDDETSNHYVSIYYNQIDITQYTNYADYSASNPDKLALIDVSRIYTDDDIGGTASNKYWKGPIYPNAGSLYLSESGNIYVCNQYYPNPDGTNPYPDPVNNVQWNIIGSKK